MKKKIRLLSVDGGGIRGIIPAKVLEYIEARAIKITNNPNIRIADLFDVVIGVSTGGLITALHLIPEGDRPKFNAQQVTEFYTKHGYDIFNKSKYFSLFGLRNLFNGSRYNPKFFKNLLNEICQDIKISDLLKPCIMPSFDLLTQDAIFFSSNDLHNKDRDFYLKDTLYSTCAAPTYFPPARIKSISGTEMVNIDGGVVDINPTMCGYAAVSNRSLFDIDYPIAENISVLSLGTGASKIDLGNVKKDTSWGILKWAKSISDIMFESGLDAVHYQAKHIFRDSVDKGIYSYKRINVPKEYINKYKIDLADASAKNIQRLTELSNYAIDDSKRDTEHSLNIDKFIENHLLTGI